MQKTTLYVVGLIALLLFAGGLFLSQMNTASTAAASSGNVLSRSKGPVSSAMGIPAIRPSSKTGAITVTDVQRFVKSHAFIGGPMVTGPGALPTTVGVLATTSREVKVLTHGESTGLPDNAAVYYVTLHGPFRLLNAHVPPGAKLPICETGIEVFDAQTGNLLMWGAF